MESTMSMPSVTVGLCVKNSEKTIAECVRSIINTEYPQNNMKVIVVDGLSTDRTLSMITSMLKDIKIRYSLLCDEGEGLASARQMAVDNSSDKYIFWVDGDNVLTPSLIRNHVEFMEQNPKIGAASAVTLSRGETVPAKLLGYAWLVPTLNAIKKGKTPNIGMQGSIIRRKAIEDAGGFDLSIRGAGEDIDLFIRMKLLGWEITANPKAIVYHHMRETWRDIFDEARWWGIGSYLVRKKYANMQFAWKKPDAIKIAEMLFGNVKLTIDTIRVTGDATGLLMPLYYLVRRAGYIVGSLYGSMDPSAQ